MGLEHVEELGNGKAIATSLLSNPHYLLPTINVANATNMKPVWKQRKSGIEELVCLWSALSAALALRPAKTTTCATEGFASLPVEILHKIMSELDFNSLSALRLTSSHFNGIVESFSAYRDLTTLALIVLQELRNIDELLNKSVNDLLGICDLFRCHECYDLGPVIFLIYYQRCSHCLRSIKEYWETNSNNESHTWTEWPRIEKVSRPSRDFQ